MAAPPRSYNATDRASRSGSTFDAGGGGGHGTGRPRRQSAYPNYSRPPPVTASTHARRRQHSIAYTPRRSTFSDESGLPSCTSSRQFPPSSSFSPSGIRHSQTEPIADQVVLLPMGNNISSRSSGVVDDAFGRSRRVAGSLFSSGRPNGGRVLSPFDELGEPSPTSLSRSSTSRGDSSSPAPATDCCSGPSNVDTAAAAAADSAPSTVVLHVSASTRADLVDIRAMLANYMKRLADKDAAANVTKEWRIVAKVFDRLFFFLYVGTILFSLYAIFPRG